MARSGVTAFTLLHGVRNSRELYYESLFRTRAKHYVPCLSSISNETQLPPDSYHGRVGDFLKRLFPAGLYDFYLCGRQEMIRDVTFEVDESYPGSHVYTETFY